MEWSDRSALVRWSVYVVAFLAVGGVIGAIANATAEDDPRTTAVTDCVETAVAKGTEEDQARSFCEAAIPTTTLALDTETDDVEPELTEPEGPMVVPDVVGMDLQTAQDTLQAAGYRHIESVDDTGRGRHQVIDSNWDVVDQTPSAGEERSGAYEIILFVVKEGEG